MDRPSRWRRGKLMVIVAVVLAVSAPGAMASDEQDGHRHWLADRLEHTVTGDQAYRHLTAG